MRAVGSFLLLFGRARYVLDSTHLHVQLPFYREVSISQTHEVYIV